MKATRLKETWRRYTPAQVRDFLRVGHEGRDHPSRLKAVELLEGMDSVLDVGCGTGVMFELIRARRPHLDYLGIDVTAQFVAAARERFPAEAARFREGSLYDLDRLPGEFDAVLCRHILEHLPDYEPAVRRMAVELLTAVLAKGEADICRDFSYRLPIHVLAEFFNIPGEQANQVRVLDVGQRAKLLLERVDAARVHAAHGLERDLLLPLGIESAVHDAHAALPEHLQHVEPAAREAAADARPGDHRRGCVAETSPRVCEAGSRARLLFEPGHDSSPRPLG